MEGLQRGARWENNDDNDYGDGDYDDDGNDGDDDGDGDDDDDDEQEGEAGCIFTGSGAQTLQEIAGEYLLCLHVLPYVVIIALYFNIFCPLLC